MTVKEQEINDVSQHSRRFQALLLSSVHNKVPSEASWLFDVR
jgi:hypothetical protein